MSKVIKSTDNLVSLETPQVVVPTDGSIKKSNKPTINDVAPRGQEHIPLTGTPTQTDLQDANTPLHSYQKEAPVGLADTFKLNVAPTARAWGNAVYENFTFTKDGSLSDDHRKELVDSYLATNGIQDERDVHYLNGAVSVGDLEFRKQQIQQRRDQLKSAEDHGIVAGVSSMLDVDIALSVVPYAGELYGAGKLARLGRAVTYGAGAGLVDASISDQDLRSDAERYTDMLTFGLTGALLGSAKYPKKGTTSATTTPMPNELPLESKPITTPKSKLDQGIQEELDNITNTSKAEADTNGSMGTIDVMGTPIHGKISRDVEYGNHDNGSLYTKAWASHMSTGDRMFYYTGGDMENPANYLLASPRTQGNNVVYAQAQAERELGGTLAGFDKTLSDTVSEVYNTSPNNPFTRREHLQRMNELQGDFQRAVQIVDGKVMDRLRDGLPVEKQHIEQFLNDLDIYVHTSKALGSEPIKNLVRKYIDTGFAEKAHDMMSHSGLIEKGTDLEQIVKRSTYFPVKWSYDNISKLIRDKKFTKDEIATFIGQQIIHNYPELNAVMIKGVTKQRKFQLSAKQLGQHFIENRRATATSQNQVTSVGMSKAELQDILGRAGMDGADINRITDKIYQGYERNDAKGVKNLRQRLNWDFKTTYLGGTGNKLHIGMLLEQDAMGILTQYTNSISKRVGLGRYGITSTADLDRILDNLVEARPNGAKLDDIVKFKDNVRNQLLGLPTGEQLPEFLRASQTTLGTMVLNNSGIWGGMDLMTQVAKVGLLRSLGNIQNGLKNVVKPMTQLSRSELTDLQDVLTHSLNYNDRWRYMMKQYDDNFTVGDGIGESIQYYGQSVPYLNLSQYIKRMQIGMLTGTLTKAFKGASKGVEADIKFLKQRMKFSDELVANLSEQYRKHGSHVDAWDNDVRIAMETKVGYESDNLAHTVRTGELPAFMEHSTIGKVLLPFMSYTFAMQQKILRNTYLRDGATGVALLGAVQMPVAVMLGMVKNLKDGKEPDENLARVSVNAFSAMGAFNFPLGIAMDGGLQSSTSPASILSSTLDVGKHVATGEADFNDIKRLPLLGATTGLSALINNLNEDNK